MGVVGDMQKEINLQDKVVSYTLRVSRRARYMRLAIHPGGAFVVTAPQRAPLAFVEDFIVRKALWVLEKIESAKKSSPRVSAKDARREYLLHKEGARALALERMKYFNSIYNFSWNKVAIRNQKSRWGSCSRKGNINFNYKIVLLPPHLADYVIVHEICHLGAFNHSPKFWALVGRTIPRHRELRSELKKTGIAQY